jgi:hypothetical protein
MFAEIFACDAEWKLAIRATDCTAPEEAVATGRVTCWDGGFSPRRKGRNYPVAPTRIGSEFRVIRAEFTAIPPIASNRVKGIAVRRPIDSGI